MRTGGLAGEQPQSTLDLQKAGTGATPHGRALFKKRYAVPPEKGAWVWLLGPMLVGLAAAAPWNADMIAVLAGATAAYMLRQPATLAVKEISRKRSSGESWPLLFWCVVYGSIAGASAVWLLWQGHWWVIWMGGAGLLVFGRHLWLVRTGDERHRAGMDIAAAGLLALTAPALMVIADSRPIATAVALWLVLWLQASGSVVHMFLRLDQRKLKAMPSLRERWTGGMLPLAHHSVNVVFAIALVYWRVAPLLILAAFLVTLIEGLLSIVRPPVRATPKQLGMRQLFVSSLFVVLVAIGYLI